MATITISYDVPDSKAEEIESMLAETALRDVNWNGAEFVVERGDFTCIDGCDEVDGAKLLMAINDIVNA